MYHDVSIRDILGILSNPPGWCHIDLLLRLQSQALLSPGRPRMPVLASNQGDELTERR